MTILDLVDEVSNLDFVVTDPEEASILRGLVDSAFEQREGVFKIYRHPHVNAFLIPEGVENVYNFHRDNRAKYFSLAKDFFFYPESEQITIHPEEIMSRAYKSNSKEPFTAQESGNMLKHYLHYTWDSALWSFCRMKKTIRNISPDAYISEVNNLASDRKTKVILVAHHLFSDKFDIPNGVKIVESPWVKQGNAIAIQGEPEEVGILYEGKKAVIRAHFSDCGAHVHPCAYVGGVFWDNAPIVALRSTEPY